MSTPEAGSVLARREALKAGDAERVASLSHREVGGRAVRPAGGSV